MHKYLKICSILSELHFQVYAANQIKLFQFHGRNKITCLVRLYVFTLSSYFF